MIETGYLEEPDGLADAVEAYRFADEITRTQAMRPYRASGTIPGDVSESASPR